MLIIHFTWRFLEDKRASEKLQMLRPTNKIHTHTKMSSEPNRMLKEQRERERDSSAHERFS